MQIETKLRIKSKIPIFINIYKKILIGTKYFEIEIHHF